MSTTSREAVIAGEQKAVDRAYDCYEARLAEVTDQSPARASASGKDSIAVRHQAEAWADEYGGLQGEALVVSRVDVQEPGASEPAPYYVGRRGVSDPETHERVVVLWTSPLAKEWHSALPEDPGEVLLRRQLRCAQRTVEDYFDEIALPPAPGERSDTAPTAAPEEVAQPRTVPPPGTVPPRREVARRRRKKPQQVDRFLLRELRRSRSGRMRDIVETIRRDQMALVTGSPQDVLVIQGGPGTGKSAVGLHRVTWLVNNNHFRARDILVVGPHQRFLEYVGRVLPTLGTLNVNAVQLARLWEGEVRGADSPKARLAKSDDRMAAVLRRRVENECRPEALESLTTAPSHEHDEPAFTVALGSTTLRLPRSDVLGLLGEAREGAGAYRVRRDRFRTLLVDRLLVELVRLAPRRSRDTGVRKDLERNRQVATLVERTWPALSPEEALRSLLNSPDKLRECASQVLSDGEQAALQRPKSERAADEPWTLDDLVCLEELRFLLAGETPQRYGHIVIDEAQDLTPMQARSLQRRCPTGSMTVLGDLAQATGPHSYAAWGRLGRLLSGQGDWRVAQLNTSYRVPAEIMRFVAPLALAVAPAQPYPVAVREAGGEAVRLVPTKPWALLDETVTRATRLVGTDDGRSLRSIAVIVPDDYDWLDEVRRRIDAADGMTPERREAVSVLAAAQAKGMEFDHVLVLDPTTIADRGPAGPRQLYVALTRSTQTLTVLHTSPLPQALVRDGDGDGDGYDGDGDDRDGDDTDGRETGEDTGTVQAGDGEAGDDMGGVEPGDESGGVEELPVGADVTFRVLGPGPGSHLRVQALSPATERTLLLALRHGSPVPAVGSELEGWVFRNEARVSLVSISDFGRRPFSPGMAARYAAALDVPGDFVRGGDVVPADAAARLSELKGMANRCLRRDQSDWLSVWRLLGSPDVGRLGALRELAQDMRDAVVSGERAREARVSACLDKSGWAEALSAARKGLSHHLGAAADTAPEIRSDTRSEPDSQPPTESQKEREVQAMDARTVEEAGSLRPAGEREGLQHALTAASENDRNCNTHEAVRFELKAALLRAGLKPSDSPFVDVSRVGEDGLFLYEVLGSGHSAYAELRTGAARLMEINSILQRTADRMYLVLSEPPADDWAADTVRAVFGVHVLWRTTEGWLGQDSGTAVGAGGGPAASDR
ncbi:AAA family ATPase [Streptomyces sp. NBC_00829]|uniref:AAA family ATPase n=1 Tax=Streptomyces sp. NBC_00829 TaxID=2903679 RepID=UPI0038656950|nr:AAA family ATPase [Streptomyces sp. NBC_00829]